MSFASFDSNVTYKREETSGFAVSVAPSIPTTNGKATEGTKCRVAVTGANYLLKPSVPGAPPCFCGELSLQERELQPRKKIRMTLLRTRSCLAYWACSA